MLTNMDEKKSFDIDGKDLNWDLRQTWAKTVTLNIEQLNHSKLERNLSNYYFDLRSLYANIVCKFKNRKEDDSQYKAICQEANNIIEKYPVVYDGKFYSQSQFNMIFQVLERLQIFLYDKMEEYNLWGAKVERDPSKLLGA
jgi:hypothetical protein